MRWFKHSTNSFDDIKLKKLRRKFGFLAYGLWFYLLETVAKDGKDCCLPLDKLSPEDMSKDTEIEIEKIKEMILEMCNVTLINKERYIKDKVIFVPQFVGYYDDYSNRVRREFGESSEKVAKNREEENRIEKNIVDIWNATSLPKIFTFSQERKRHLKERIKNKHFIENYAAAIKKIAESDFCNGRVNGKEWKATVDWLITNDNNYVKVLEGKYDNRHDPEAIRRQFDLKPEAK